MKDSISSKASRRLVFAASMLSLLFALIMIVVAPPTPTWWDTSWHYRVKLVINNSDYSRTDWPVEQRINFTELLWQQGISGTFDTNSIRVVEHNSTGGVMHNVTYQFDAAQDYSAAENAAGELIFFLNGTTPANGIRNIYIYFDIIENGAKSSVTYTSNLKYSWDGEEAIVNNTLLMWKLDTLRGKNTSGIYEVRQFDIFEMAIVQSSDPSEPTVEYVQYSNATNNFSFDFRNNATFTTGPLRIILEQKGNETLWNSPDDKTGSYAVKRYIFYENSSWIRVEQEFVNPWASEITRSSTPAGAPAVDRVALTIGYPYDLFGNTTNPSSYYGATAGGANYGVGIIIENQTGTLNYFATNSTDFDRIGASLSETAIPAGGTITETAVMLFKAGGYTEQQHLQPLRNSIAYPPKITLFPMEIIPYSFNAQTNYSIYNRNESVLIFGNTTFDQNNASSIVNATIDMGTPGTSDDVILSLYDDGLASHGDAAAGDKIFSNYFNLSESSVLGTWNVAMNTYDSLGVILNQSSTSFNVTDAYNTTLVIWNSEGFINRLVNATLTLKNFRQDTFVGGATVSCGYGSTPVTNIIDYGNGTYAINFTAPAVTGTYLLNCNATKFNNTGFDSQYFWTETAETLMTLNVTPQEYTTPNISVYSSDSFNITTNSTNVGGANARSANITIYLPSSLGSNPVSGQCGQVVMGTSCIKSFNITVANRTLPGNYTLNVSTLWQNADSSKNTTNASVVVHVLANPLMNVFEDNASGTVADEMSKIVGNITVRSFGNTNATNVTFNVSGLGNFTILFTPANISYIEPDANRSVAVNVSVPVGTPPGNYSGIINVSSGNDGWDAVVLNISVPALTNMSLNLLPSSHTSGNILVNNSDSFVFNANATDIGIAIARYVNITLVLPQDISSNSTFEECGNITISSSCIKSFNITVANRTLPGNYTLNVSTLWRNPDATINFTNRSFVIYVLNNPKIEVLEPNISSEIGDGNSSVVGNITVRSFGNTNATNVTFNVSGLGNFTILFTPANISYIEPDANRSVAVNVSVPVGTPPGNYSGIINVSSGNNGWTTMVLNISVPRRLEWSVTPEFCEKAESPPEGTLCSIYVINSGNDILNFTITPSESNHTKPSETAFVVFGNTTHVFAMLYNVTNVTKDFFTATYNITVIQNGTNRNYTELAMSLIPQIMPILTIAVAPLEAEQAKSIGIFVNATDKSGTGIRYTELNVTLPNGTIETFNMTRLNTSGNFSRWYFNYSGNMQAYNYTGYAGRTYLRGIYLVNVSSFDSVGIEGPASAMFSIYAKPVPRLALFNPTYEVHAGDKLLVNYSLVDGAGVPLSGATTNLELRDSAKYLLQKMPPYGSADYITDNSGTFSPPALFELANNVLPGLYNLTANTTYHDDITNKTLNIISSTTFNVYVGGGGGGGGMSSELETATRWYPQNTVFFDMTFFLYGNATDPDEFILNVDNPIASGPLVLRFTVTKNGTTRIGTGHYRYSYTMGPDTVTGIYIAKVNSTQKGYTVPEVKYFTIDAAGSYDLKIDILKTQVEQGLEDLEFEITMINQGDLAQDVDLEYWAEKDGQKYYFTREIYYTLPGTTVLSRSINTFGLPEGQMQLYVNMTYSSWKPSLIATKPFDVVSTFDIENTTGYQAYQEWLRRWRLGGGGGGTGGEGGGKVTGRVVSELPPEQVMRGLAIVNYPQQVSVVRGWTDIQSVEVKNDGSALLKNITLEVVGLPPSWVTVTPESAQGIPSGNSTIFILEFKVPKSADAGDYGYTIVAKSGTASDEKAGKLTVYLSTQELIKNDINRLKLEVQKLEEDTDFAEKIGKNVDKVRDIIDSVREEIKLAEDNVQKGDYDNALASVQTASNLLKRGRQLLESATALPAGEGRISMWIVGLIVIILVLILAGIILLILKSRGKLVLSIPHFSKIAKEAAGASETAKEEIDAEKEKIDRMSKLLAQELKDGTITQSVYDELKGRNDERLQKLERGIKK